ncbi:transporter [Flavonifractor porci]|uniref:transporter n=1 Tax=Flavonifractor porci TaxID=3133422 RepID=UPI0030AB241E
MSLIINLIPIVIILVVLFMRKHMLFAGLLGAIAAMVIGQISLNSAAEMVMTGVQTMFSYTAPIMYAAAAVMVARGGSFEAIVKLAESKLKSKMFLLAGFLVLVQSMATYMAGMGAGNTMVIAPLVAAAVGAVPEVIAGMAIATAVCFTTSPSSTETILAAESAGRDVVEHASAMMPMTLLFVAIGAVLAAYGVHKHGSVIRKNNTDGGENAPENAKTLYVRSIPAIALLVMVIAGSKINGLIGFTVFTPATNVIFTAILTAILTPLKINKTCEALGDGSRYILTTLFSVGFFLSFINIIGECGTFAQLAALVGKVPQAVIVPCAIIMAFLIAIPSGAFCAGVLTLILPTMSFLGLSSEAMGLVAIAAGFGTQVSPVQINVAALSDGFQQDIMTTVKGNAKYLVGVLVLLILASFVFA